MVKWLKWTPLCGDADVEEELRAGVMGPATALFLPIVAGEEAVFKLGAMIGEPLTAEAYS